jgi:hypothetical protein
LHRVGSQIVNSYLIVGQDGVTIIDAGLPGYRKLLQAELAAMGKTLADVRALILTRTGIPTTSASPPGCTARRASRRTSTRRTSTVHA